MNALDGVHSIAVSLATHKAMVQFDPNRVTARAIIGAIEDVSCSPHTHSTFFFIYFQKTQAGFTAELSGPNEGDDCQIREQEARSMLIVLFIR